MSFGNWDTQTHDSVDQLKRICSARKISANKIVVDSSNQTAIVYGSAATPYNVTLNHCDCGDFAVRGLPCKHIYRLALDLGFLSELPAYSKELAKEVDFDKEIERYHALYVNGALSAENYVKLAETISKLKA
jgi:hypothetical protein